jgi:hypothetical protein
MDEGGWEDVIPANQSGEGKGILRYPLSRLRTKGGRKSMTKSVAHGKIQRGGESMTTRILLAMFVLLLFGVAQAEEGKIEIPIGNSPAMGPVDAPITIIEFIDFQ